MLKKGQQLSISEVLAMMLESMPLRAQLKANELVKWANDEYGDGVGMKLLCINVLAFEVGRLNVDALAVALDMVGDAYREVVAEDQNSGRGIQ